VQSIGNGLIRYSNNYDEKTGVSDTIDIVKLVVDPGSPGYSLMHVDKALAKKLETTDLKAEETASGYGVKVVGIVNGSASLLFKARSYHSKSGNVIRTIIEGGDLLDDLATVPMAPHVPTPAPATPAVRPTATPAVAPAPTTPAVAPTPAPATPAVAPVATQQARPVNGEEEVAEEHGKWQAHKEEHVSELQRMLHLAKYSH
jgi:hypothetical protein